MYSPPPCTYDYPPPTYYPHPHQSRCQHPYPSAPPLFEPRYTGQRAHLNMINSPEKISANPWSHPVTIPYESLHKHSDSSPWCQNVESPEVHLGMDEDSSREESDVQPCRDKPSIKKSSDGMCVEDDDNDLAVKGFPGQMEPLDLDSATWTEMDFYWNESLLSIVLKLSQDANDMIPPTILPPLIGTEPDCQARKTKLERLQLSMYELILQAPSVQEQENLLDMVTTWARELGKDPWVNFGGWSVPDSEQSSPNPQFTTTQSDKFVVTPSESKVVFSRKEEMAI